MAPSKRARLVANFVALVQGSGLVRGCTDEPPGDYVTPAPSWAWVFEGNELRTEQRKLANRTERAIELHLHDTYLYVPGDPVRDLHKLGRERLARWQELVLADWTIGGEAWLTEEAGNAIGIPAGTERPIGILSTTWIVHYDTPMRDPRT